MASTTIQFEGRAVHVEITARAQQALAARATPLLAEMELYFSCLIRKAVRFRDYGPEDEATSVSPTLALRFRPVTTASCSLADCHNGPPLADLPLRRAGAFTPHWLYIDYHRGEWRGEFGYRRHAA